MAASLGPLFLLMLLTGKRDGAGPSPVTPGPSPAPGPSPSLPPAPGPPPPTPSDVKVPPAPSPNEPSTGRIRAVEVWHVDPSFVARASAAAPGSELIIGAALNPAQEANVVEQLQAHFPRAWLPMPASLLTHNDVTLAENLLKEWRKGGLLFNGPKTMVSRRAFRMTEHERKGQAPSPTPPTPAPDLPTPPAPGPSPAAPKPAPTPAPTPPTELVQTTRVRKGEGLANVAHRAGQDPKFDSQSIRELQEANVPTGPGGTTWEKTALSAGGLKLKNRKGGLQPGDVLFIPSSWGRIDPAKL